MLCLVIRKRNRELFRKQKREELKILRSNTRNEALTSRTIATKQLRERERASAVCECEAARLKGKNVSERIIYDAQG